MRTLTPADLEMSAVDLKSASTYAAPNIIDVQDFFQFRLSLAFTVAGGPGSTGLAKWVIESYDPAGNLIDTIDLVTGISTKTTGTYAWCGFGGAGAPTPNDGTLATGAEAFGKVLAAIKPKLVITEVNDASGAATASAYLQMDGYIR